MNDARNWMRSVGSIVVFLLTVAGIAACATGGTGAAGEGSTLLRVENDLIPSTSLTVYAIPEVGARTRVGVVNPGATATLRFNPLAAGGQYRFVAETTAGGEIVSNPVIFSPGATIEWSLNSNIAVVSDPG